MTTIRLTYFLIWFGTLTFLLHTRAEIITVTTNDSYVKIEAANPGDEIVISPGIYSFRVHFTKKATAEKPIRIHALDPAHPPVWDFGTNLVENAPGSHTAGDRGRGGWQFSGADNYRVSGIIFRNCRNAEHNAGGIRYYGGTKNLYLKDCLFELNDNGLTGGSQDSQATVECCEFRTNGNSNAAAPTHNLYIYGGDFTMRYCFVHDSAQAENFHLRCRNGTMEYNWFARAKNYEGDLMTDTDFSGSGPFTQTLTLRGNIFLQSKTPANHSQLIALLNDSQVKNLTLSVRLLYNTFVGTSVNSALVHLANSDGTKMTAEISNNIIFGVKTPLLVDSSGAASISGGNNWLPIGVDCGLLQNSIQTESPGFRNSALQDFTLLADSPCIGRANASISGKPDREYFKNEIINRQWRLRPKAGDIGAFESTNTIIPVALPKP